MKKKEKKKKKKKIRRKKFNRIATSSMKKWITLQKTELTI